MGDSVKDRFLAARDACDAGLTKLGDFLRCWLRSARAEKLGNPLRRWLRLARADRGIEEVPENSMPLETMEMPAPPGERAHIGWVSPSYTTSRRVTLDLCRLADNRCVALLAGSGEAESYRVLRTRILQKTGEGAGTTVMITSAVPGEGKTLTAINLALTFAREFKQTALLVDCDLRQQRIHEYCGFAGDRGLADYLLGNVPLEDLIVWPGIEKLTLISGGRTVRESSEIIGSPRMEALVKDLKSRYPERYVFFDVPPVLAGADALAFAPFVDHILFVVRAGETPLPEIRRALQLLPQEKLLGLVLNRADVPLSRYDYGQKTISK
jgi:protein-tyrosine kinase